MSPLGTWLSSRLELVTWAWAIGTASCLGRPQSLCPDLGSVPTEGPACCSCPGCHAQPFSNHSSCGSAGSQEPAQLWRAHVHLWRECRRGAEALGGGRSRRLFWPNAVISLERTQPCPDSAAARARLGQVGPQSQEPRAGGGVCRPCVRQSKRRRGGLWPSPLDEGLGWRGSKRRSCFPCLLIKRTGFGQGGSCRCLQNKGGGGRPEASMGTE